MRVLLQRLQFSNWSLPANRCWTFAKANKIEKNIVCIPFSVHFLHILLKNCIYMWDLFCIQNHEFTKNSSFIHFRYALSCYFISVYCAVDWINIVCQFKKCIFAVWYLWAVKNHKWIKTIFEPTINTKLLYACNDQNYHTKKLTDRMIKY